MSLGVVPQWPPPCLCLYYFFAASVYTIVVVQYFHVFFPICEHCACMWKFLSLPGPLVFPGPIFMNQREQALARIRPLQALRHKRDKHKGTMVFTNSTGAGTPTWLISQSGCPAHLLSYSLKAGLLCLYQVSWWHTESISQKNNLDVTHSRNLTKTFEYVWSNLLK